jgi:hypothetical protein
MPIPDSLAERIALFRERGQLVIGPDEMFTPTSWLAVLLGQNIQPRSYSPLVAGQDSRAIADGFRNMKALIARRVEAMPSHADYLKRHGMWAATPWSPEAARVACRHREEKFDRGSAIESHVDSAVNPWCSPIIKRGAAPASGKETFAPARPPARRPPHSPCVPFQRRPVGGDDAPSSDPSDEGATGSPSSGALQTPARRCSPRRAGFLPRSARAQSRRAASRRC